MLNFVQPGKVVTVPAPSAGANSGDPVLVGSLFGVAAYSAEAAAPLEIACVGVFDLPKNNVDTFAIGDVVYFDSTNKVVTATATNNKRIGTALLAALASDPTARVRLDGFAI